MAIITNPLYIQKLQIEEELREIKELLYYMENSTMSCSYLDIHHLEQKIQKVMSFKQPVDIGALNLN